MLRLNRRYWLSNMWGMTANGAACSALCSERLHISWDAWGLLRTPTVETEVLSATAPRIFMSFRLGGSSHTVMGYTSISM